MHLITLSGTQALGRTALDEGSVRRRDLYLTTLATNIHATAAFEPRVSASEWPQTHILNCAATGTYTYLDADTFGPDLRFLVVLFSVSTQIPE